MSPTLPSVARTRARGIGHGGTIADHDGRPSRFNARHSTCSRRSCLRNCTAVSNGNAATKLERTRPVQASNLNPERPKCSRSLPCCRKVSERRDLPLSLQHSPPGPTLLPPDSDRRRMRVTVSIVKQCTRFAENGQRPARVSMLASVNHQKARPGGRARRHCR